MPIGGATWTPRGNRSQHGPSAATAGESDRQITGRRRVQPLDPAARGRAAHLAPDAPRILLELDDESGAWMPVGVAENADQASRFLNG
ncbi:DUF6087 family protein [Streptomyces sp. NPDC086989]|uniref:DUF6087 family protein n=1 Tax=Streptomyces sp. NPDC086989 TaxID=3365764 RepID=UPI0037F59918